MGDHRRGYAHVESSSKRMQNHQRGYRLHRGT